MYKKENAELLQKYMEKAKFLHEQKMLKRCILDTIKN